MRSEPVTRRFYGLTALLGLAVTALALSRLGTYQGSWLIVLGLGLLVWLGLLREFRLSADEYHSVYTLEDVPVFCLIFTCGWAVATVVVATVRFGFEVFRLVRALWRHPDRVTFDHIVFHFTDIANLVVTTALAGTVYQFLNQGQVLLGSWINLAAILACALVWFPAAFLLNAVHVSLQSGGVGQAQSRFWGNVASVRFSVVLLLPLGVLMGLFVQLAPWATALLVVPVAMVHNSLEARRRLIKESKQTIQALAHYLDERDPYTLGHSQRVARYAAGMAEAMGLPPQEVALIRRAGLIHDLGKIDVPDAILRKAGRLTETEREVMRGHTDRAVELGQRLVALRRGLPFHLAAYHHECYDGSGHFGLKGNQIPLASRVLAVADTYDAMTSDRPYRKGLEETEALMRLQKARGTQLDPSLVDAFMVCYNRGVIGRIKHDWEAERRLQTAVSPGRSIAACQP